MTLKTLSSDDDKRMQSFDSIETYAYRTSKEPISDQMQQYDKTIQKLINFDDVTKKKNKH